MLAGVCCRSAFAMTRPPRTPTRARWRTLIAPAVFAAWLALPAGQTPATEPALDDPASFRVDKATLRAEGASAALIDRVSARALRFFRLLARASIARTCLEFRDLRWRLPAVAVHGDAHLEQFVVTGQTF